MEELKKLVEELEEIKANPEDENTVIVSKLKEIGKKFLKEYVIKIGDLTIEPLWVEAYYFNNQVSFTDPFVYRDQDQMDNFGGLYFHHATDDSRSGVDICFSLSCQYYLSYLLKYTLVNGELVSQGFLSSKIRKAYEGVEDKKHILVKKSDHKESQDIIGCTQRIGLKKKEEDKAGYREYELAIAKNFDKKYTITKKLPQIERLTKSYLSEIKTDKEKWCLEHLGYCPKEYKGE